MQRTYDVEMVTQEAYQAIGWIEEYLGLKVGRITCYPLRADCVWYLKASFRDEDAAALFKLFWYHG